MSIEDLTTFTEVDTGNFLTITAPKASVVLMPREAPDTYLYKDYGANYFDDLKINFEGLLDHDDSQTHCMMRMGLTVATVNDWTGWGTNDISMAMRHENSGAYVYLLRGDGETSQDSGILDFDINYYFTFVRAIGSATVQLKIYSDASRTTLVDTLEVTLVSASTKFRYLFPIVNDVSAQSNRGSTGYYQNFDLNLTPPAVPCSHAYIF